ncbi:unnamed protein product [Allacma fusca]|uniref:Carboxylesterase type B domain-containing protein n=1 Tax=Allacma fusca TaxID=39272 RepID=A0A8J2KM74_9HEXA|nr:unnamed protein product [Allacma fusca]
MEGTVSLSRDGREFYEWLGIPYARPPVGNLRFQSPGPIDPWSDLLDAKTYGPDCAAIKFLTAEIVGEEDCLYLNVHAPKKAAIISGAAGTPWSFIPPDRAVRTSKSIARRLKCPSEDTEEIAGCLRDLDIKSLLGAITKDMRESFLFKPHLKGEIIGPTLEAFDDEDSFMMQHPFQILSKGKFQKVPLLAGVMADEGLSSAYPYLSDESNLHQFDANMTENIRRICLYSSQTSMDDRISEQIRDYYLFNRKMKISDAEEPSKLIELFSDCFYNKHISRAVDYQRAHANAYIFYFNMKGGPSNTDLMMSLDSTFAYYKYLATYYVKSVLGEAILGSHHYGTESRL